MRLRISRGPPIAQVDITDTATTCLLTVCVLFRNIKAQKVPSVGQLLSQLCDDDWLYIRRMLMLS